MVDEKIVLLLAKGGNNFYCPCLLTYKEKTIKELQDDGYEYTGDYTRAYDDFEDSEV